MDEITDETERFVKKCERCDRTATFAWWWQGSSYICSDCYRRERKAAKPRRRPGHVPHHAKPFHCGMGIPFRPDRMPGAEDKWSFNYRTGERKKWNDRTMERQYRKRQRRVDQFLIDEALAARDQDCLMVIDFGDAISLNQIKR